MDKYLQDLEAWRAPHRQSDGRDRLAEPDWPLAA